MNLHNMRRKWLKRRDVYTMHFLPSFIVFMMMMVLIGFSWRTAVRAIETTKMEAVEEHGVIIESNISRQLQLYDSALTAGVGYFKSNNDVTRDEWKQFINALEPSKRYSGVLGIGYAEVVTAAQKTAFENRIRSEGFRNFQILPNTPTREIYTPIIYIEPFNQLNSRLLGFDMYSQQVRRDAMDEARDSADTVLSGGVELIQDDNENRTSGLLLYAPHFEAGSPTNTQVERNAALRGFVYAPIRSIDMFPIIFSGNDKNFNTEITDITNGENAFIYRQNPDTDSYEWLHSETIDVFGRTWELKHSAKDEVVPDALRSRPMSVVIGGTIFAVIVAAIVYLLLQRRTKILSEHENKKVERAKDDLLSLASHQLRTPATGVKQYVGMVLEGFTGQLTTEQQEILKLAYVSNERQLRIINEFLYLAKADADRIILSPQDFNLSDVVKEVVDDMQTDIQEAGHTLRIIKKSKNPVVTADVHSVRMIIENLISNAIKYTPSGGKLVITVAQEPRVCTISVQDNGVGIDKKDFPRLFQQFSRIPNSLTKQTSGSGIGLYLAEQLAKRNDGEVTVVSTKAEGSVFTLRLPKKTVKKFTEPTHKKKVK